MEESTEAAGPAPSKILKWGFIICNGLLMLLAAIGLGFVISSMSHQNLCPYSTGSLVTGLLVVLVTVLGFCSCWLETKVGMATYIILMFMLFILSFAALAVNVTEWQNTEENTRTFMSKSLQRYKHFDGDFVDTKFWNLVQKDNGCCGMEQSTTGTGRPWEAWKLNDGHRTGCSVPWSCCLVANELDYCTIPASANATEISKTIHVQDCYPYVAKTYPEVYKAKEACFQLSMTFHGLAMGIKIVCLILSVSVALETEQKQNSQ